MQTQTATADFSMMQILSPDRAAELTTAISEASKVTDTRVGVYDDESGFCVRVYVLKGTPAQWFIRGPLTPKQAQIELMAQHMEGAVQRH